MGTTTAGNLFPNLGQTRLILAGLINMSLESIRQVNRAPPREFHPVPSTLPRLQGFHSAHAQPERAVPCHW